MKIALAQLNPTIGDIDGNRRRILDAYRRAVDNGADLVVTPELSLVGYPPRDLLLKPRFVTDNLTAFERLVGDVGPAGLLVGFVDRAGEARGLPLHNAAALVADGRVLATKHKSLLPTYDVFDETRYFEPGAEPTVAEFRGLRLGLSICEDIWTQAQAGPVARLYHGDPIAELVEAGAEVLVNMSASPFVMDKFRQRVDLVRAQGVKHRRPVVYVNQVGGNDQLIFDGASFALDASGRILAQLKAFEEDLVVAQVPDGQPVKPSPLSDIEALRRALVLGIRDYMRKCGFKEAVLGLSGGIDSSLVACLAAEAVGAEHVVGVFMPSRYSSCESLEDALSDVPKTFVYELARHINASASTPPIPERVFTKAPSAELTSNQTDQDTLPPYDVLDRILDLYVREERSRDEIVAAGFDPDVVRQVIRMVDRNEYKRAQAAPGLKVTGRAFGVGRRMPIAQRYEPNSR